MSSETTPDPDGIGPLLPATNQYAYDQNGRLTAATNPDNSQRLFTYDSADNLTTAIDELNQSTSFTYDALARLLTVTDRVGAVTTFVYNAIGLLISETNALGKTTDYEYHVRNWMTKKKDPDPDAAGPLSRPESTFGYDNAGNLTSEGKPSYLPGTTVTYTFDDNDRLTKKSGPVTGAEIDYAYDNLGRAIEVTAPTIGTSRPKTKYEYNSRGWLTKVTRHDLDGTGP